MSEVRDFIGKVVIENQSKTKYVLTEITAPYIAAKEVKATVSENCRSYVWDTINGDPFTNNILVFEDSTLNEIFRKVYEAHCHSKDGYWEDYGYWMRKD